MAGPQFMGGTKNPQPTSRVNGGQQNSMEMADEFKGMAHPTLDNKLVQDNFKVGSAPGAPTVKDGGWNNGMSGGADSNATVTGGTDMRLGSRMKPGMPKNVYTSGPSVK